MVTYNGIGAFTIITFIIPQRNDFKVRSITVEQKLESWQA